MILFRTYLIAIFSAVAIYTLFVAMNHGLNLIPLFFGDIAAMTWAGQFNLDFLGFLILSGAWLAWRHHFSPLGLALFFAGIFGGIAFLAPYLFFVSLQSKGDIAEIMMGRERARTR
ncbi:MAG: hypothetical protein Q7T44_03980 [Parvibaculum sp.]|nr:hypothetical protein [Parvibaculum sp.]